MFDNRKSFLKNLEEQLTTDIRKTLREEYGKSLLE